MVRVYLELSILISLANPLDLFHIQTRNFMDEMRTFGFEAVSCRQAVEMDLAIGLTRRPLRVGNALRILEVMDAYEIKLFKFKLERFTVACQRIFKGDVFEVW